MATLYWGGGSGTWNGLTNTNWYTDVGRTTLAAYPPGPDDDVVFDANSSASSYSVTLTNPSAATKYLATTCRNLSVSGPASGTVTFSASFFLPVYGSVNISTGVSWPSLGLNLFSNTACDIAVSVPLGTLAFFGDGTYTLQAALTTSYVRIYGNCTFNTNDYAVAITSDISYGTYFTNAALNFGASTVTTPQFYHPDTVHLDAGTSTINIGASYGQIGSPSGDNFYNVNFTHAGGQNHGQPYCIRGNNTFNNLSFSGVADYGMLTAAFEGNNTVNGTLNFGTNVDLGKRIFIKSLIPGTPVTLTVNSVAAFKAVDFADISFEGAAAPLSGESIGDAGGNSGIIFTAPKTVYLVATSNCNWFSSSTWGYSSGGAPGAPAPLAQDTVIIDDATLPTGAYIYIYSCLVGNVICTRSNQAYLYYYFGSGLYVCGDFINTTLTATANAPYFIFIGRKEQSVDLQGLGVSNTMIYINGVGQNVSLSGSLTSNSLYCLTGGLKTNNFNVASNYAYLDPLCGTIPSYYYYYGGSFSFALGSSTFTTTYGVYANDVVKTVSVDAGTSTYVIVNSSGSLYPATWYNVTVPAGSFAIGYISMPNATTTTVNNLSVLGATTGLTNFILYTDLTVNGTLTVSGASVTQRVAVGGGAFTAINYPAVTPKTITANAVSLTNVDFVGINAAGAATWSGTSIGDAGANSGITFTAPKTVYWNLAGTQNWNSAGWSLSSGGTPDAANFPLAQDTCIFDDAGSADTVTYGTSYFSGAIDLSARTTAMTFAGSATKYLTGDYKLSSAITYSALGQICFYGDGVKTIDAASKTFGHNFHAYLGTVKLGSAYTSNSTSLARRFIVFSNFDTSGYSVTLSYYISVFPSSNTNFRNSTVTFAGVNAGIYNINDYQCVITGSEANFVCTYASSVTFYGDNNYLINSVTFTAGTSATAVALYGGMYKNLTVANYRSIAVSRPNVTTPLTKTSIQNLSASGTSGTVVCLATNGQNSQYANLNLYNQNIGANSVDAGGNSGLSFTGTDPDYMYVQGIKSEKFSPLEPSNGFVFL